MLQALSLLALFFMLAPSSAWSASYYVANNGNDASSGLTLSAPFKTIQKAMNTASAGDTVYVRGGTYREEITANRGGSAGNYLNVFAYNNEVPVISGSELVTGWVKYSGNIWKKTGWTVNSQQVFDGSRDGPSLQQIGMPSSYYDSFKYPSPVGSGVSSMVPGSFYYAAGSSTLYIWLANGADPNTLPIEVSTRRRLLYMARPYIHMKGFAFRHTSASAYGEQGAAVELSSYSIMENSDIQYTDFAGLNMGYLQTGALVTNCNVSNNGDSGINAAASYDFRIANSIMNNNNTRNFNPLWHAGGFKGASKTYGTLESNEVGYNKASGIWFDFANSGNQIVIRNNYIHDNGPKEAAIFMEVSKNAMIYDNVIANNERRGIYLSASDTMHVYNNTVVGTRTYSGIELGGMPRATATLTGNAIYNNIISHGSSKYDLVVAAANGSTIAGNTSDYNNIYRTTGAAQMIYGTATYTDLTAWRTATRMDSHSISANPNFVLPKTPATAANYAVLATSPVIDSGTQLLSAVPYDYSTTIHKADNPYDIGAFELAATSSSTDDKTAPVIVMSNPNADGIAFKDGMAKINIAATDNVAVTGISLYVDGKQVATTSGQPIAYTWDMRALRVGTHTIYVSAMDAKKNMSKVYRSVMNQYSSTTTSTSTASTSTISTSTSSTTATTSSTSNTMTSPTTTSTTTSTATTSAKDETSPVIKIVNPTSGGSVSGTLTVQAQATDNVAVTGINLYIDGGLKASAASSQVAFNWNTAGLRKGTHSIWVSAMDGSRNMGKQSIAVVVQ